MKFIRVLHAEALNYGILYHGTDTEFNNFEEIYQNGGYLGKGFYFTLSKSMAESYGNIIIKVKLFCKNSFFINDDIFGSMYVATTYTNVVSYGDYNIYKEMYFTFH